jgi:hypothetical protein
MASVTHRGPCTPDLPAYHWLRPWSCFAPSKDTRRPPS